MQNKFINHVLVVIYSHPEHFPPTLNAVGELSKVAKKITLVYRPSDPLEWDFAENVELIAMGEAISAVKQLTLPVQKKAGLFFNFIKKVNTLCKKEKPELVLLYDPLALGVYSYSRKLNNHRPLVWYHNHDVFDINKTGKFSVTRMAVREEPKMFPHLDLFTLPSQGRKKYFPMEQLKGKYIFLPNLPTVSFYVRPEKEKRDDSVLRLIFQGQIGNKRGIEELLGLLPLKIKNREVHLVLKGRITDEYKSQLKKQAADRGASDCLKFVGFTSYKELPSVTKSCHVGLALFTEQTVMTSTIGTASNKIYEYAAASLPVLYFDNEYFRSQLGGYKWTFGTDLTLDTLKECLEKIVDEYEFYSTEAKKSFESNLNYESKFEEIKDFLTEKFSNEKKVL